MFTSLCDGVKTPQVTKHPYKSLYVWVCVRVCVVSFIAECHIISIACMEVKVICVPSTMYRVDADITDVMEPSPDRGLVL